MREKIEKILEKYKSSILEEYNHGDSDISDIVSKEITIQATDAILKTVEEELPNSERILEELIYISWCLNRDGRNNLIGKEALKTGADCIRNLLIAEMELRK